MQNFVIGFWWIAGVEILRLTSRMMLVRPPPSHIILWACLLQWGQWGQCWIAVSVSVLFFRGEAFLACDSFGPIFCGAPLSPMALIIGPSWAAGGKSTVSSLDGCGPCRDQLWETVGLVATDLGVRGLTVRYLRAPTAVRLCTGTYEGLLGRACGSGGHRVGRWVTFDRPRETLVVGAAAVGPYMR